MVRGRVVLGYSATGGGHRQCALAVAEEMSALAPDVDVAVVDLIATYAPPPYCTAPGFYRHVSRNPLLWTGCYALGAGPRRARGLNWLFPRLVAPGAARVYAEQPADLYACFHPALAAPLLQAPEASTRRSAIATVVTDLTSMTAWWFTRGVDACLVPTERARGLALRSGLPPASVHVTGLPVASRFRRPEPETVMSLRTRLGVRTDRPVVLVAGGADGIGPLAAVTDALALLPEAPTVLVVCGSNDVLVETLRRRSYPVPVRVFGTVPDMFPLMAASDIFVTKAGPSSLAEAFAVGLPIVLIYRIPGQEKGNVTLATAAGAGVWAPGGRRAAAAVAAWLRDPVARRRAAERSHALARPEAATEVAARLLDLVSTQPASTGV